jgi:hypothetical protein
LRGAKKDELAFFAWHKVLHSGVLKISVSQPPGLEDLFAGTSYSFENLIFSNFTLKKTKTFNFSQ